MIRSNIISTNTSPTAALETTNWIEKYIQTNSIPDQYKDTIAKSVATLSRQYRVAWHLIQEKSIEDILQAISQKKLYVLTTHNRELIAACQLIDLFKVELWNELLDNTSNTTQSNTIHVYELWTLLRNPWMHYDRQWWLSAGAHIVNIALQDNPNDLILATSRNKNTSWKALANWWMDYVEKWNNIKALQALTCDPTCRPSRAWQQARKNCNDQIIDCLACSDKNNWREDECSLYLSNTKIAEEINRNITQNEQYFKTTERWSFFSPLQFRTIHWLPTQ